MFNFLAYEYFEEPIIFQTVDHFLLAFLYNDLFGWAMMKMIRNWCFFFQCLP